MPSPARGPRSRLALGLLLCLPVAAGAADAPRLQPPRFDRDHMVAALDPGTPFLVVYGTLDPAAAPALRERARALAGRYAGGDGTSARADREVPAETLAAHPVVLLGAPRENLWTRRLAGALPVAFAAASFRWQGTVYDRPDDAIQLVWPHPLDPVRFLVLVAGNTPAAVTGRGVRAGVGGRDWRITRAGETVRSGRFAHGAGGPWRYDPALDRDLDAERAGFERDLVESGTGAVRLRHPAGLGAAPAARAAAEALAARLDGAGFADPMAAPQPVTLHPSLESKGRLMRDTRPEHLDAEGAPQVAVAAGRAVPDLWSLAVARLRRRGAAADSPWLLPAGVWLAGRCEGEPFEVAVARLVAAGLLPGVEEAAEVVAGGDRTASAARWRSPLILVPARALLMRALYETAGPRGAEATHAVLAAPAPTTLAALCARAGVGRAALARRYGALAASLARAGADRARARGPRRWRPSDGFQAGVCLAHSVGLEGGYLSSACARELARLRADGAGWVSLTPFGYLPDRGTPVIVPGAEGGPGEESDEAVAEAAARARESGLRVWLKPHLWTRGFVGELEFGAAGWPRFFERYREFILHYALLAEREGMDGLVLGHELTTAALGHPRRWRALIAEVRRVYHGTLTYGANWGEELRGVRFWDALDVVGVSLYTPLADAPTRDPARLRAGARRAVAELAEVARRAGRPALVLEAGYPPHAAAAVRPWEERGGARDLEAQRACYEALVDALEGERWVAGLFWWKWFSDGDAGGPADRSHTPRGKPAEAVMTRGFAAWRDRPVSPPPGPGRAPGRPGPP